MLLSCIICSWFLFSGYYLLTLLIFNPQFLALLSAHLLHQLFLIIIILCLLDTIQLNLSLLSLLLSYPLSLDHFLPRSHSILLSLQCVLLLSLLLYRSCLCHHLVQFCLGLLWSQLDFVFALAFDKSLFLEIWVVFVLFDPV